MLAAGLVAVFIRSPELTAQPGGEFNPADAGLTRIVVESVTGSVQYRRGPAIEPVTTESELRQGDMLLADVGSVCKLEFQHPESREVQAAVIVRGYTEMTVAEAFQDGPQPRTRLDVGQGLIRAGVVRSAVPPSFRVRTPRSVVAVRGTEVKELEASNDRGDVLKMGHIGTVGVNDSAGLLRFVRAGQGTRKRAASNRRETRLLRAIENAVLEHRVLLSGPHRRDMEDDFAERMPFDPVPLPTSWGRWSNVANPARERLENGGHNRLFDFLRNFDSERPPFEFPNDGVPFPPNNPPFPPFSPFSEPLSADRPQPQQ